MKIFDPRLQFRERNHLGPLDNPCRRCFVDSSDINMSSFFEFVYSIRIKSFQFNFFYFFKIPHVEASISFDVEITDPEEPIDDLSFLPHVANNDELLIGTNEVRNEVAERTRHRQPVCSFDESFFWVRSSIQKDKLVFELQKLSFGQGNMCLLIGRLIRHLGPFLVEAGIIEEVSRRLWQVGCKLLHEFLSISKFESIVVGVLSPNCAIVASSDRFTTSRA